MKKTYYPHQFQSLNNHTVKTTFFFFSFFFLITAALVCIWPVSALENSKKFIMEPVLTAAAATNLMGTNSANFYFFPIVMSINTLSHVEKKHCQAEHQTTAVICIRSKWSSSCGILLHRNWMFTSFLTMLGELSQFFFLLNWVLLNLLSPDIRQILDMEQALSVISREHPKDNLCE